MSPVVASTEGRTLVPADVVLGTAYVVRARSGEVYGLWHRWSHVYGVDMRQRTETARAMAGSLGGHPIEVRVTWYVVAGSKVAFVEPTSEVIDTRLIDNWIGEAFFGGDMVADRCFDAADFQQVVSAIFAARGEGIRMRDLSALDRAIAKVPIDAPPRPHRRPSPAGKVRK